MADVTISSLPIGTPSGNVVLPYSDGSTTYTARPSAIVAASSGSVLQMQFVPYVTRYTINNVSTSNWQSIGPTLSITTKSANSKILLTNNISVVVNQTNGYCFFSYIRNGTELTNKAFGIVTRSGQSTGTYIGWDSMTIQFVDTPNVPAGTVLNYTLAVKSRSGYTTNVDLNDAGADTLTHFIGMEIAA